MPANNSGNCCCHLAQPNMQSFQSSPAHTPCNGTIQIRVVDMLGRQVYLTNGSADKNYRFGENFKPGLYLVEITSGNNRSTRKL